MLRVKDARDLRNANAAREDKWAAAMANRTTAARAAETSAKSNMLDSITNVHNAETNKTKVYSDARVGLMSARETARHNVASEGLTKGNLDLERTKDERSFMLGKEKNATDRMQVVGSNINNAIQAKAQATESNAKAGLLSTEKALQDEYLDPKTTPERKKTIQGLWTDKQGHAPKDTKQVIPGRMEKTFSKEGGFQETQKPPLIVNEADGTYEEAKEPAPVTFKAPEEKLESLRNTDKWNSALEEYKNKYKKDYK